MQCLPASQPQESMSLASPLQSPLGLEESLTNGVGQELGLATEGPVALGVSGDKPCGEKAKMGEEVTLEEAKEATNVCDDTITTITTTTTSANGNASACDSSMPPQANAKVKWDSEETDQYLPTFQLAASKDGSCEDRVSGVKS